MNSKTDKIIKENIKTINNNKFKQISKKLGFDDPVKGKEEIENYITNNIYLKLSKEQKKDLKEQFYKTDCKANFVEELANKNYILKEHMISILTPSTDEDWDLFFSKHLEGINKKKSEYDNKTSRIPSRKEALKKLKTNYDIFISNEKKINNIWKDFVNKDFKYESLYKIATNYSLYYKDLESLIQDEYSNRMDDFLERNLFTINGKSSKYFDDYKKKIPNNRQIEEYLGKKLLKTNIDIYVEEAYKKGLDPKRLEEIANSLGVFKNHLDTYIKQKVYSKIVSQINLKDQLQKILFEDNENNNLEFIKKEYEPFLNKISKIIEMGGFGYNKLFINSGKMTANAGDAGQFLFISRAILLGYNCSNVDVRSSRYDAVIDYDNILLKIQVKSFSDDTISYKDRDRGGNDTDSSGLTSRGSIIDDSEVNLYVAVDKQTGLCYIIPMSHIKEKINDFIYTENINKLEKYKENWDEIQRTAIIIKEKIGDKNEI